MFSKSHWNIVKTLIMHLFEMQKQIQIIQNPCTKRNYFFLTKRTRKYDVAINFEKPKTIQEISFNPKHLFARSEKC